MLYPSVLKVFKTTHASTIVSRGSELPLIHLLLNAARWTLSHVNGEAVSCSNFWKKQF